MTCFAAQKGGVPRNVSETEFICTCREMHTLFKGEICIATLDIVSVCLGYDKKQAALLTRAIETFTTVARNLQNLHHNSQLSDKLTFKHTQSVFILSKVPQSSNIAIAVKASDVEPFL